MATIRDNDLALKPLQDVTLIEGGQPGTITLELERVLHEPAGTTGRHTSSP